MNSRDLNSINEAFAKATTKVIAEKTKKEKALPPIFKKKDKKKNENSGDDDSVEEVVGAVVRGAGKAVGAALKGAGAVAGGAKWLARGAGKAVDVGAKKAGDAIDKRRDKKKQQKIANDWAKKQDEKRRKKLGKDLGDQWEAKQVKEDLGPDFGDEEDFGDPSRHSGDYLDAEPLDVGDIVEVEGEDDDFVVLNVDGEWVQAAVVGDGIEVKRDNVVKKESVRVERKLVTLKEKKKVMSFTNIMEEFENRLSSSAKGFSLKSKLNEEDGTSFDQPDEGVGPKLDKKKQRPADEEDSTSQESSTKNVDDDVQEPKEADKADENAEEKNTEKEEKVVKDSINNSNKGNIMSEDKSIFDKLYEQVMSEDDDFGAELGIPGDDGISVGDDEFGDEGGEDITVTLTPDQADAIRAVADQLAPTDDLEDELNGEEEPEEGFSRESAETVAEGDEQSTGKPTTDGKDVGKDPSDGAGNATELPADALGGKSTGTGDAKVTDDAPTTGKPTTDGKTVGDKKHGKGPLKANAKT